MAWPGATLGAMGPEGAVRLAARKELEAIPDRAAREQRVRALTAMLRMSRPSPSTPRRSSNWPTTLSTPRTLAQ